MKHTKGAAGGNRRPGGAQRKPLPVNSKVVGNKRKAEATAPPIQADLASGDADDFMDMLDTMEDYKPVDDDAAAASADVDLDLGADQEQRQQLLANAASGSSDEEGAAAEGDAGQVEESGKRAKKRRKRGQKLSSIEFEARRQLVRQIAACSAEEQADWLWASYQQHTAASALERGGLVAEGISPLPTAGSLEDRLKSLQPGSWQQEFCNRSGGKKQAGPQQQQQQQKEQGRSPGSPSLLLIAPSAIGAVNLIKLCPGFNQACRIGKLFAKHMKVHEQEEALRSQVLCIAAGTPNRLCKLADGGALSLEQLKHVVLDVQLDAKQRDILAISETRADWWLFFDRHLKERLAAGSLKLSLVNSDDVSST